MRSERRLWKCLLFAGLLTLLAFVSVGCAPPADQGVPQVQWEKSWVYLGGETGRNVLETNDGGYIIAAQRVGPQIVLIKTDGSGNEQWNVSFDGIIGIGNALQQTTDGGYILTGRKQDLSGFYNATLIKTDSLGRLQWEQSYGDFDHDDAGFAVEQTTDGGYIVTGIYKNAYPMGEMNFCGLVYLIKTNETGSVLWERNYSFPEPDPNHKTGDWARSVRQTSDGGYILAGASASYYYGPIQYALIIKTDNLGEIEWYTHYHLEGYYDEARVIQETSDGGYVFIGEAPHWFGIYEPFVAKMNHTGSVLWSTRLPKSYNHEGSFIQQTEDGGYIAIGQINKGNGQYDSEINTGDLVVSKLDDQGRLRWDLAVRANTPLYQFTGIQQTTDNGYILTGGKFDGSGQLGVLLVKLQSDYVNPFLVSNFTANPTDGYAPLDVTFTDQSTGSDIYDYYWNFGDGRSSTEQNPVVEYTDYGGWGIPPYVYHSMVYSISHAVAAHLGNNIGLSWAYNYITILDPPAVAVDDSYLTSKNYPLSVPQQSGVLKNDYDYENYYWPLTAQKVSDPLHGSVNLSADGSFWYYPAQDFYRIDSFQYLVNDTNSDSSIATVTILINAVPSISNVLLTSTSGSNLTTDDLTVTWEVFDEEGNAVKNITNWYINGSSLTLLNLPLEGGSNETYTRDYSGYEGEVAVYWAVWDATAGHDGFGTYHLSPGEIIAGELLSRIPDTQNLSISVWVNPTSLQGYQQRYFTLYDEYAEGSFGVSHDGESSIGDLHYYARINGELQHIRINTLVAETWTHIVATYDGSTMRLYQDGVEIASLSAPGILSVLPFYVLGDWESEMDGYIDDVLVFNRTLTPEQVLTLHQGRTDRIVSQETNEGEIWQACITPNDGYGDGTMVCSNTVTITAAAEGLTCSCGSICVNATGWWRQNGTFNANPSTPIQAAVDNAASGETICVTDGAYEENVDVNTANLTIRSANGAETCIVTAATTGDHVFEVTADNVTVSGFTVTGATTGAGIYLDNVNNCTISNNTAGGNLYGIYLDPSSNNNLTGNTVTENNQGIYLYSSSNNNISFNWVHQNTGKGFYLAGGSTGNKIEYNNIMANGNYNATSGGYEYDFYNDQEDEVEAKYNYWMVGTNDTIDVSIYDYDDDESKGKVTFYPFETGPVPSAPIPEAATILLLSTGLLALAGYVWLGKKKNNQ